MTLNCLHKRSEYQRAAATQNNGNQLDVSIGKLRPKTNVALQIKMTVTGASQEHKRNTS